MFLKNYSWTFNYTFRFTVYTHVFCLGQFYKIHSYCTKVDSLGWKLAQVDKKKHICTKSIFQSAGPISWHTALEGTLSYTIIMTILVLPYMFDLFRLISHVLLCSVCSVLYFTEWFGSILTFKSAFMCNMKGHPLHYNRVRLNHQLH